MLTTDRGDKDRPRFHDSYLNGILGRQTPQLGLSRVLSIPQGGLE